MPHRQFSAETFAKTADQIRARMRHICAHMSPEEYEDMVQEMARVQLKYQAIAAARTINLPGTAEP